MGKGSQEKKQGPQLKVKLSRFLEVFLGLITIMWSKDHVRFNKTFVIFSELYIFLTFRQLLKTWQKSL